MEKSYWNVGSLDIMINFKSSETLSPSRPLIVSSRNPASRFELVSKITAPHVLHALVAKDFFAVLVQVRRENEHILSWVEIRKAVNFTVYQRGPIPTVTTLFPFTKLADAE